MIKEVCMPDRSKVESVKKIVHEYVNAMSDNSKQEMKARCAAEKLAVWGDELGKSISVLEPLEIPATTFPVLTIYGEVGEVTFKPGEASDTHLEVIIAATVWYNKNEKKGVSGNIQVRSPLILDKEPVYSAPNPTYWLSQILDANLTVDETTSMEAIASSLLKAS